jgi:hypothetical protein
MRGTARVRARRVDPKNVIRAGGALAEPDYLDAFEISAGPPSRSAEQWARACLEGAPLAMRWFLLVGWRFVLGLRLGPRPSPDHVFGWTIVSATPELVILGVRSVVVGQAQLLFRVEPSRAVLATVISFDRRGASAVWSVIGLIHRRALPYLLTHAAKSLRPTAQVDTLGR